MPETPPRSLRFPQALYLAFEEQVEKDGVSVSFMLQAFAGSYADGNLLSPLPEVAKPYDCLTSVRCTDDVWTRLHARAKAEGTTASKVLRGLTRRYLDGELGVPRVVYVWDAA